MNKDKIGAIWKKDKFSSGVIEWKGEKINIVIFPNTYKDKENQPDYNILLSKPKEVAPQQEIPVISADTDISPVKPEDIPF